jgi:hypothetical protein
MPRQYWLDLFTYQTWTEFLDAGGTVSGFRENRWKSMQSMKPGDYLLCYLTGISRWIGLLEVTGPAFKSSTPIWKDNEFPARIPVQIVAKLEPLTAVPVLTMKEQLSFFKNLKSPHAWTGWFRGSPQKWSEADGEAVVTAVVHATEHPVEQEFDPVKLAKVPPILLTESGAAVTVPEEHEPKPPVVAPQGEPAIIPDSTNNEESEHTEVQWLLAKLGNDLGLGVWVAKNDLGKTYKGQSFKNLPNLKTTLPIKFDLPTQKTIELIDLIWLKGNSIIAAFEIESTTQIFSGLLRMADLIAMHSHLNIPLYIVAPSERRTKVITEVNRPIFSRLEPPMSEMCALITFETLREKVAQVSGFVKVLKPEVIEEMAESCVAPDV